MMRKLWIIIWSTWLKLSEKLRFILVGGFNTLVSYLIFVGLVAILGKANYQFSLLLAWIISSIISFSTQKIFVFCSKGQWCKEYIKCCASWMVAYLMNAGILELSINWLGWNVYGSQGLAILITTVITYVLFKKFAFKRS